jgi:GNAT superfamily N-acetyltransferase
MIYSAIVTSTDELKQILQLQQQNLKQHISEEEKKSQGFVTMSFTLPMLQAMHELAPSVIVKDDDKVVAYAIVFLKEGRHLYPNLEPMFINLEKLSWKEKPLNCYSFYIMGQICVAKEYRGKGVFELLYRKHKETYSDKFDFVITEISITNYRSLRAHKRTGFQTIAAHKDQLDEWAVVLWNWQS